MLDGNPAPAAAQLTFARGKVTTATLVEDPTVMPPRRKIAATISLLALTLGLLLLASALAWACGPAAPAVQDGGPAVEAEPTAAVEPTAAATPTARTAPTPTPGEAPRLELVAQAVFRLAEQERNRGASGASGASSGPQLPDRIYVHVTAWTGAVDDLERMLRDNGATDISVIKDGKVSRVESQAPPGLLPEITRHLAFLHAFTSGIYSNMEQSLNDDLTMYAGGLLTAAEVASSNMRGALVPEYPEHMRVIVELVEPEYQDSIRDFLASNGSFLRDKEPGASWFYAVVRVPVIAELSVQPGVDYIEVWRPGVPQEVEPRGGAMIEQPAYIAQTIPANRQSDLVMEYPRKPAVCSMSYKDAVSAGRSATWPCSRPWRVVR